jgi:c-di-GMP-binding flagellar brake protein YcgR
MQNQYLKKLCAEKKIVHPGQIFSDYAKTSQLLEERLQALAALPATKETEAEKTTIFLIREAVENRKKSGKRITSSRMIPERQELSITLQSGEQYLVELLHNSSTGLVCNIAKDADSAEAKIPLWTRITVFFTVNNDQSYRFPSRLIKYDTDTTELRMVFAHTDSIEALPMRSHSRKNLSVSCTIAPVTVANVVSGGKTERRFYPAKNTFSGVLQDISAGGCSVQCKTTLKPGEYAEIRCILDERSEDSMIGKIVRTEEATDTIPVMHIQFAKIPRATMNRIFTYIFTDGDHKK